MHVESRWFYNFGTSRFSVKEFSPQRPSAPESQPSRSDSRKGAKHVLRELEGVAKAGDGIKMGSFTGDNGDNRRDELAVLELQYSWTKLRKNFNQARRSHLGNIAAPKTGKPAWSNSERFGRSRHHQLDSVPTKTAYR